MRCQNCEGEIGPDVRFCSRCGAPVISRQAQSGQGFVPGYAPLVSSTLVPRLRVGRNLQALGVLWCLFGAYRIITGLLGMFFLKAVATHAFGDGGWPFGGSGSPIPSSWMEALVPFIAVGTILSAAFAFVTGYGLLTRRSWGRTVAIIAAILALLKIPMGTVLGTYTLWVLAPGESGLEYEAMAANPVKP